MFAFGDKEWPGLAKVAEECGELVQVIGKLMMTHGQSEHWEGSNLRENFVKEMADVQAALEFQEAHVLTSAERDVLYARRNEKVEQFEKWHKEQEGSGDLAFIALVEQRAKELTGALKVKHDQAVKALAERNEEIEALKREQRALVKALGDAKG